MTKTCPDTDHDYTIHTSYTSGNVQVKIVLYCRKCGDILIQKPEKL